MVKVFSFCIFGSQDKYCKGLLRNIEIIKQFYPDWETWVYIGNATPPWLDAQLKKDSSVKVIYTEEIGMVNKVYRFFPIDSSDVEVCIVRDTDSRIHAIDRGCINDFLESDKMFHIIRDHPNHFHRIMAGMFGVKQGLIPFNVEESYHWWKEEYKADDFWDDTFFLVDCIYPGAKFDSLIHDEYFDHEPHHFKHPFSVSLDEKMEFVGQVYDFDENGNEYTVHTTNVSQLHP